MNSIPHAALIELGITPITAARLLADPEAILTLGSLSFSVLDGEVQCFDHTPAIHDTFTLTEHPDHITSMVSAALKSGEEWKFLDDEPQLVAVMSFEVEPNEAMA